MEQYGAAHVVVEWWMKYEMQLAPFTSRLGVAQASVAPDTRELFSGSIYTHERYMLAALH